MPNIKGRKFYLLIAVIAMPEEIKLLNKKTKYIVTGIGAINIINSLKDIDKNELIYNIGYAGSNIIPIGEKVSIGKVKAYHPNVKFIEPEYQLSGTTTCYTAGDFVLNTKIKEPCVFDMELAYILALGFKNVIAEKVVSDCLSKKQFYKTKNKSLLL